MQPDRSRSEIATLQDLLGNFATEGWGPERAEEAFDLMADRYRTLNSAYEAAAGIVAGAVDEGTLLPTACRGVLLFAHQRLFEGITTNAGSYRQHGDPGGSEVSFGGVRGDRREWRFKGAPASDIDAEMDAAFALLADRRGAPGGRDHARDAAVRFYAELSRIHPFYDANGRSGRFVVSVYLHLHGWLVEWGRLNEKEFIRRINNVNEKRTAQTGYKAFLLRFWAKHVVRTDDLG